MYFEVLRPEITDVNVQSVWAAGAILNEFGGNFNLYVKARDLIKQEGIVFRHLLRLILLCEEFMQLHPPELTKEAWKLELSEIADRLTETCRVVDPTSTKETIQRAHASADVVAGETKTTTLIETTVPTQETLQEESSFGEGLFGE